MWEREEVLVSFSFKVTNSFLVTVTTLMTSSKPDSKPNYTQMPHFLMSSHGGEVSTFELVVVGSTNIQFITVGAQTKSSDLGGNMGREEPWAFLHESPMVSMNKESIVYTPS